MKVLRSFRQRIFAALLAVALVPVAVAVGTGVVTLREIGSTVGTLGPWDAVAASGRNLIDAALRAAPGDSSVAAAADVHRTALSESVRWSRLWSFVTRRFLEVLPVLGLVTGAAAAIMALLAARWLSGGFSRPIRTLVGWTERIARGEPLPPRSAPGNAQGVEEFRTLRNALRTMAAELETARDREVRAARLRAWTDMARRVAHEIKNPLTPMRIAATTLARRADPTDAETGRILLEEIARLDEMARSFAQFGRMPEGARSDVDLAELSLTLAHRHSRPGVSVDVEAEEGLPMVRGHHDVLERAFRNLLVNAQESVEGAGGSFSSLASVRILLERVDGAVRIRVRDRGPGIPEDLLETLWLPDVTTKRQGTGLGLAIVRQAVDAHGGTATARNLPPPEGGAEIEIVLPLEPPSAASPPPLR